MKQPRPRNLIFSFLLLFASVSISAAAGEVILRLLGYHGVPQSRIRNVYYVDDPILDWRRVPNSEIKEGRVVYKYNSSGFRDLDHAVEKPLGVKRIVVVGDSVTEGHGVEWTSTFSRTIQSHLGDKCEVITIAAGGLNTPQEVHLFEQAGLPYKPDLVILNFVLNDGHFYTKLKGIRRYHTEKDSKLGLLNLSVNPRLKRLLKSSTLIYFIKERVEEIRGRLLGVENTDYYTRLWAHDENRRKVTRGFDKLAALQKEHHFDVLVIVWPLIADYRHYRLEYIHRWVQEHAENRGFSTIDLLPKFSKFRYRGLQVASQDNVHPNALGHRTAATSFLAWYRLHYGAP